MEPSNTRSYREAPAQKAHELHLARFLATIQTIFAFHYKSPKYRWRIVAKGLDLTETALDTNSTVPFGAGRADVQFQGNEVL
jgi:hypothetical protein